jgi:hypothetical protein
LLDAGEPDDEGEVGRVGGHALDVPVPELKI